MKEYHKLKTQWGTIHIRNFPDLYHFIILNSLIAMALKLIFRKTICFGMEEGQSTIMDKFIKSLNFI